MDFEFIDEDDIESVKRGRKSTVPQELIDMISALPAGKACRLTEFAGNPADEGYNSYKASVSAMIRAAGKQAGKLVAISWSPAGVPQVRLRKSSGRRK